MWIQSYRYGDLADFTEPNKRPCEWVRGIKVLWGINVQSVQWVILLCWSFGWKTPPGQKTLENTRENKWDETYDHTIMEQTVRLSLTAMFSFAWIQYAIYPDYIQLIIWTPAYKPRHISQSHIFSNLNIINNITINIWFSLNYMLDPSGSETEVFSEIWK